MKKVLKYVFLFAIACLFAGLYGVVHNQISYSVSPEYFTHYKFPQFRLSDVVPERLGAAIVGWMASWWMGGLIAIILIPVARKRRPSLELIWMMRLFLIVAMTTLLTGIVALFASFVVVRSNSVVGLTRYGNEIQDGVAFIRAGTMHNASYLGGFFGLLVGLILLLRQRQ